MAKNNDYVTEQFTVLIDQLELPDLNKQFMKSRWLDQLSWLEKRSGETKRWSNRLRLMIIVGGVLIPALVSLNFTDNQLGETIGWVTFGLSQVVAISAAVEEYFHFSDKYTQYRQTAECLKSEAWQFLQFSGFYKKYSDHETAYPAFATRVEQFIQKDVQTFVEIAKETAKQEEEQQENLDKNFPSLSKGASTSETSNVPVSKSDADFEPKEEDD